MGYIDRNQLVSAWLTLSSPVIDNFIEPGSSSPPSSDTSDHQPPHVKYPRSPWNNYEALPPLRTFGTPCRNSPFELLDGEGEESGSGGGYGTIASPQQPLADSSMRQDGDTYARSLKSIPSAVPPKRKRKSQPRSSNSVASTSVPTPSEVRAKRRALELLTPSTHFGLTPSNSLRPSSLVPAFPPHVLSVLRRFAPSEFEQKCLPFTSEIESLLASSFPTETFPPGSRIDNLSTADEPHALALLEFAVRVHCACARNSAKALDEVSWYPCVRSLLSVDPPSCILSQVPSPAPPEPHVPSDDEFFLTIDASTKSTSKTILPNHPNVKLDFLLAFNPDHRTDCVSAIVSTIRTCGLVVNAFNDISMEETVVALGVEVKTPGGNDGTLGAEFQVGVWAAKTLTMAQALSEPSTSDNPNDTMCDLAVAVVVCGHVWSIYITYWKGKEELRAHGPIVVGSTDTLYGTLKIIKFVVTFKEWARERLWVDWSTRVRMAADMRGSLDRL